MPNEVTHFEIYGDEPERLADFYRELFGWQIEKAPGVEYWRVRADAAATNGLNGGLTYRVIPAARGWVYYISVESLDATVSAAVRLGAEVLRPKTAVPKTAWVTILADPAGNVFGVWQADPTAMPPPDPD